MLSLLHALSLFWVILPMVIVSIAVIFMAFMRVFVVFMATVTDKSLLEAIQRFVAVGGVNRVQEPLLLPSLDGGRQAAGKEGDGPHFILH